MIRLADGPAKVNAVVWGSDESRRPWPPPERLRVWHFGDTIVGMYDDDATSEVPNFMEAVESLYVRVSFSKLPDDHVSDFLGRGAEYTFERDVTRETGSVTIS